MRSKHKIIRFKARFYIIIVILICVIVGAMYLIRGCTINSTIGGCAVINQRQQGVTIMLAAKKYINNKYLTYDASYFSGGYPAENIGVCTDVVWNGLSAAGVDFKKMVDHDIKNNFDAYSSVISIPDPNIDFRYVPTIEVFFQRNSQVLSTRLDNLLVWQPGDIVTFESSHVAIISCLHNLWGQPYVIQHGRDPAGDEDRISAIDGMEISGHFRWV